MLFMMNIITTCHCVFGFLFMNDIIKAFVYRYNNHYCTHVQFVYFYFSLTGNGFIA